MGQGRGFRSHRGIAGCLVRYPKGIEWSERWALPSERASMAEEPEWRVAEDIRWSVVGLSVGVFVVSLVLWVVIWRRGGLVVWLAGPCLMWIALDSLWVGITTAVPAHTEARLFGRKVWAFWKVVSAAAVGLWLGFIGGAVVSLAVLPMYLLLMDHTFLRLIAWISGRTGFEPTSKWVVRAVVGEIVGYALAWLPSAIRHGMG